MGTLKTEIELNPHLLTVPVGFDEPRLRQAGLAWLDMAVELFNIEVFSVLEVTWHRPTQKVPVLTITLDPSKNHRTKPLQKRPDAPPESYKPGERRRQLDAAVKKLLTRTTPEDLWAALVNQGLGAISAFTFISAWSAKVGPEESKDSYPRFTNAEEFLFHIAKTWAIPAHPWL
jgi:hypothetical protein